jgi:hypothetical protein
VVILLILEDSKAYDIGDVYIGYGSPRTNTIYMRYQFVESNKNVEPEENVNNDFADVYKDMVESDGEEVKEDKDIIGEHEFDDEFDPLEYFGLYNGDKNLSSLDEGDMDLDNMNGDMATSLENRINFFENKKNSNIINNGSVASENESKILNFSDVNSKIKSNLSLAGENLSFTRVKEKIDNIAPTKSPKRKRIPFVKNVTPNGKQKSNPTSDTSAMMYGNNNDSNIEEGKFNSVISILI